MSLKSVTNLPILSALVCAAWLTACATATAPTEHDAEALAEVSAALELPAPARGFQVETRGLLVDPGDDVRWCEVLQVPGEPSSLYPVTRIEAAMSEHGRDLIVSAALLSAGAEDTMAVGASVPCTRAGEAFGEDLRQLTATQHGYHEQAFPDGVGKLLRGGQKLAVEYHFFNTSEDAVAAKAKVNFHTGGRDKVRAVSHTASFQNFTIYTPPGGRSSHIAECRVSQPVEVSELVRRTQRHGTDFSVWLASDQQPERLLWKSSDYRDSSLELATPLRLQPGEGFRFRCDYVNRGEFELRYGVNASDEMCTLNALYTTLDNVGGEPQGCLLFEVDGDGVAR